MALGDPLSDADVSGALAQKDVGRTLARNILRAFMAQGTHIDLVQEMRGENCFRRKICNPCPPDFSVTYLPGRSSHPSLVATRGFVRSCHKLVYLVRKLSTFQFLSLDERCKAFHVI
jgi:hypothetical protein